MIQCLCSSSQTACTCHATLLKNLYEDSHGMRKQPYNPTVCLLLKSSKRFMSETGENSTTLHRLHQQPTTTNALEIVATTTQKHFAHCSDNYTTLCTLLQQLCNNTLPTAVTTLKIAKKTLKHFADCRENSTQHHC